MAEATALILKQWGVFGAVLIIAGLVIVRLWADANAASKKTIETLTADNKSLTDALATSNAARLADHVSMTSQLLRQTSDVVSALTNSTNAIEASVTVSTETKQTVRDVTEELRRRRGA